MLFLKGKESELIKRTLHQFETISSNNVIGLYLPDGSEKLQKLLQHYHFMTASPTPDQKTIYLRDTNTSFNKIDLFVSKSIVIKNPIGDIIIESKDNDVDVSTLQS